MRIAASPLWPMVRLRWSTPLIWASGRRTASQSGERPGRREQRLTAMAPAARSTVPVASNVGGWLPKPLASSSPPLSTSPSAFSSTGGVPSPSEVGGSGPVGNGPAAIVPGSYGGSWRLLQRAGLRRHQTRDHLALCRLRDRLQVSEQDHSPRPVRRPRAASAAARCSRLRPDRPGTPSGHPRSAPGGRLPRSGRSRRRTPAPRSVICCPGWACASMRSPGAGTGTVRV